MIATLMAAAAGLILLIGGASVAGIFFKQRSMMYFPSTELVAAPADIEDIRLHTRDGETLVAWRRAAQEGQPTFLFFDGNSGRPNAESARWEAITARGGGFLAVYYRGYSGSTGHPTEAGLHEDARAGYDWLIAHGVRPTDIVIYGVSLGSGVAVKLAAERPARALILEAPFSAAVDVAQEEFPYLPASLLMLDQFRSRDIIGNVRMPVFIAHGDADETIPFEQGQRLFALAHEPKQFVRFPGVGHNGLVRAGVYDAVWAFLDAHPPQTQDAPGLQP
ncbi:MAG: alpha/beta hydrolase [Hyphomonadaceae bacterium]